MKLLAIIAAFCAGAAAHHLLGRREQAARQEQTAAGETVYELEHEEAQIVGDEVQSCTIPARVKESSRAMDPLTLTGASRVTFVTEDDTELKFHIPGENGAYILPGEEGLLSYKGSTFISFEKASGEIIGVYYRMTADAEEA